MPFGSPGPAVWAETDSGTRTLRRHLDGTAAALESQNRRQS
ncbi:hypothetical protein [Streptomyces indiaensis]|nr:hypothetical protein [Streptomyces indiaensis]